MATSSKRKQLNLSMEQKLSALKRLEKGESVNKVAMDFGVGKSTIGDWKRKRAEIEAWCAKRICSETLKERKNMKESEFNEVSEALYLWFRQAREKGTPISGPILHEKALKLYQLFKKEGEPEFVASVGWLDRWKKRYGVRQLTVCGEKLSGDMTGYLKFKDKFQQFIESEGLTEEQIYNCDETGLNFRLLPNKSLALKHEKSAPGYKRSKERVTILACSNATGEHKIKLCLIGKAKKPRAFKHIDVTSLPVWYKNQSNAWMNGVIFKDWFYHQFVPAVERHLELKNLPRKALLILDNAASHPDSDELHDGDIQVMFLPPNVTALCQPMDQGVLATLKKMYRRKLLSHILVAVENDLDLLQNLKKIDLLDVIGWIANAWSELRPITLKRSWRKLVDKVLDKEGNEFPDKPDDEDCGLVDLIKQVPGCEDANDGDVTEWMEQDTGENILSDEEIVEVVQGKGENEESIAGSNKEDMFNATEPTMSHSEGLKAVECALTYFEQQGASAMDILFLRRLRHDAACKRDTCEKQTTITKFFSKK